MVNPVAKCARRHDEARGERVIVDHGDQKAIVSQVERVGLENAWSERRCSADNQGQTTLPLTMLAHKLDDQPRLATPALYTGSIGSSAVTPRCHPLQASVRIDDLQFEAVDILRNSTATEHGQDGLHVH